MASVKIPYEVEFEIEYSCFAADPSVGAPASIDIEAVHLNIGPHSITLPHKMVQPIIEELEECVWEDVEDNQVQTRLEPDYDIEDRILRMVRSC
jgi:hypothetical protein